MGPTHVLAFRPTPNRSQIRDRLDALATSSMDDSSKLAAIHPIVQDMQKEADSPSLSDVARDRLGSLFEDMYGRYETVEQAHLKKTLRWIFSERADGGDRICGFNDEYSDDEDHPSK
jgi:hypothetical protein